MALIVPHAVVARGAHAVGRRDAAPARARWRAARCQRGGDRQV